MRRTLLSITFGVSALLFLADPDPSSAQEMPDTELLTKMARMHAFVVCNCHFLNGSSLQDCDDDPFYFFSTQIADMTEVELDQLNGQSAVSVKGPDGSFVGVAVRDIVNGESIGCSIR